MRVLFSFRLKLNLHHPYKLTSPLHQALKQNHGASYNCYILETLNIQKAFKRVIAWNRMIRCHANLARNGEVQQDKEFRSF